jgi:hypothetical protein
MLSQLHADVLHLYKPGLPVEKKWVEEIQVDTGCTLCMNTAVLIRISPFCIFDV